MVTKQRPTGVTILAVLALIGGVLSLFGSIALFGTGALLASAGVGAAAVGGGVSAAQLAGLSGYLFIAGVLAIIGGILDLAFGIGAFRAAPWAWMLGIIAEGLSVVFSIFDLILAGLQGNLGGSIAGTVISIAIAAGIIYYLNTPQVKAYFGRA